MKPVVSASQIAAQAYAQGTGAQNRAAGPRAAAQPAFPLDAKGLPEKGTAPVRRVSQETEAFRIEISAEALEAAKRDGGRSAGRAEQDTAKPASDVAEIAFQPVESATAGAGRREAPFAHEASGRAEAEPPRRPGTLLDITV